MPSFMRTAVKRLIPGAFVRYRGPRVARAVALTFDDGPHPELTPKVLAILKQRQATATFFVIGQKAESQPQLVNRMIEQGCEVGNHTYSHPDLSRLSLREMRAEIDHGDAVLRAAAGVSASAFRPPRGFLSSRLMWGLFRKKRLPAVLWSVYSPHEYLKTAEQILADLRQASITAGDIILLHDAHPGTVEALPAILDLLEEKQLRPVSQKALCDNRTNAAS